jgi:hypothetical protein
MYAGTNMCIVTENAILTKDKEKHALKNLSNLFHGEGL